MKDKKIFSLALSLFLIGIMLIGFAQAAPFTNIIVDKNESSFAAGNTQQIATVSFDNSANTNQSLAVELNITSNSTDYPVEKEDFSVYGLFNSTKGGVTDKYVLKCFERYAGSFWCYNMTETNRIVLPNSNNKVNIYATSKVNLYPAGYNFTLVLYSEVGMPKVKKPIIANFTANETKTIDVKNETGTTLDIFVAQNISAASINITTYDTPTVQTAFGVTELNKYVSIEASPEITGNLSWVIIKIYYTDAEVAAAGLDESTLRIHYYNATDNSWEKYDYPNGGVDTVASYVWANTTHFSLWGLFGNAPAPSAAVGGGAGGGGCLPQWTCTAWSDCSAESLQTRTCTNLKSYCPGIKPAEEQACTVAIAPVTPTTPTITPTTPTIQTVPTVTPGILGAVMGALKTPAGIIMTVVIFVALIGLAFPVTNYIRKSRGKKKSSK